MEKFVCVNGSDNLQIPSCLLEQLSVAHPQDIHMNAGVIFQVAQRMEQSGWIRLPFCNTLLAEALGATPTLSVSGARIKEPAFAKPEEFMTIQVQETARLCAMLEALAQLSKVGKKVAYNIEGPLTLLCALLPMNKVFSALRKPIGKQMLSQVEEWIVRYAEMAVERGAKIISFADPIATVDILGSQMFVNQYVPCLLQLLIRLQERFPDTVIHLCGKLTQSLIDTKQCTLTRWEGQKGQSYGQTLTEFCGKGGIVGHYCLNYLGANRNYLELIDFTEKRNENER